MIKARYYDVIRQKTTPKETKSGDEIVADIIARAGLELA